MATVWIKVKAVDLMKKRERKGIVVGICTV
jgi:hypothetical protein